MLFNAAVLALATSSAVAWPLGKRQAVSSAQEVASSLLGQASSLLKTGSASASAAPSSSAAASSSAASSSAASSNAISSSGSAAASGSSLALSSASPSASASITGNVSAYGFECPTGYYLTYAINTTTYDVPLSTVTGALSNWASASAVPPPGVLVNSTGTNETGATRTWTFMGFNISEQLANATIDATTGSLNQIFVTVSPIAAGGQNLSILNATESLTVYQNTTTNATTAQYFINACGPTNQTAGREVLYSLINGALTGFGTALSNSTNSTASASGSASSSMVSSSAMSSSSMVSSSMSASSSAPASSASSESRSESASRTEAVSSVAGAATSAISGILSSAVAAITSAV